MKENNNIPETELFTAEIEDTIDDLFKPAKKIEIDPLTQEVKEVQPEPEESSVEFELSSEDDSQPAMDDASGNTAPADGQNPVQKSSETLLELDLELELEDIDAQDNQHGKDDDQPRDESQGEPVSISDKLEQLKQQLFTIEWEVTEPQLHETLGLIKNLLNEPELNSSRQALSMMELMHTVIQNIHDNPETVSA
ncbi:MAG: hypothetical protein DSZ23_03415, partial [Thermodesulfatator sp.]